MLLPKRQMTLMVHCRIGSLESQPTLGKQYRQVHCRIGSLEKPGVPARQTASVHCRIGSLEKKTN